MNFAALSTHPLFYDGEQHNEDIVFVAVDDVDMTSFPGLSAEMLPVLGVIEKIDADFKEGNL